MSTLNTQLAYQEAAVGNAGPIDLIVMLYDIVARDLQRAAAAMETGDIELRTRHLKHGFLALEQLEVTVDQEKAGELAANMSRFYGMVRSQIMKAQFRQDPAILRELIRLLFNVREAWVELKGRLASGVSEPQRKTSGSFYEQPQVRSASWNS